MSADVAPKKCGTCGLKLFTTDKGICPACNLPNHPDTEYCKCLLETSPVPSSFVPKSLEDALDEHIIATYHHFKKNKSKAAEALGVTVKTLYNHLTRLGIHVVKKGKVP